MAGGNKDWRVEAELDDLSGVPDCKPLQQGWHCLAYSWVWHLHQLVVAQGASCRVGVYPVGAKFCFTHFLSQLLVLLSSWCHLSLGKHLNP